MIEDERNKASQDGGSAIINTVPFHLVHAAPEDTSRCYCLFVFSQHFWKVLRRRYIKLYSFKDLTL